ncbi:DUF4179 domain-containing protein [Paenibacillus sp. GCM10027626]|uniref:DUF4179 domain-containing protein n=1 Tax=Paenibacillus sp. GCM10027626 TaxID=3273411 RepID=UPI0036368752
MNDSWIDEELGRRLKKGGAQTPQLVKTRVDETLAALPAERRVLRKIGYTAIAACVAFGGLIGVSLVNPDMARAVRSLPVIGSVFEMLGDDGIRQSGEAGLSSRGNVTAEDQGIAMTITEVLYDGIRLSVGYVIEGDGEIRPERPEMYADGKSINFSSGERGDKVKDGMYAGLIDYKPTELLPDQFTLKLEYRKMKDWERKVDGIPQTIEGAWTFAIPVKKLTDGVFVHTFSDNDAPRIQSEDATLIAKKVTFSPATTSVEVDMIEPADIAEIPFHQNLFQLLDDRGVFLQFTGASSSSQSNSGDKLRLTEHRLEFAPIGRIPEYLIVRPYSDPFEAGEHEQVYHTAPLNQQQLPITLSQGEAGKLTASRIEFTADETKLYYDIEGNNPYEQAHTVWIEDDSGNKYKETMPQLIQAEPGRYSFVMKLPPIDAQKRLTLSTIEMKAPEVDEQLELKIPIR